MPSLSDTVLTDRTSPTPVSHTFVKRDVVNGVGTVVESASGVPLGANKLSASMRVTPSGKYKPRVVLTMSTIETDDAGNPYVYRQAVANVEFTFDQTSTKVERNNLVGMLASALGSDKTLINDTVVELQGVY